MLLLAGALDQVDRVREAGRHQQAGSGTDRPTSQPHEASRPPVPRPPSLLNQSSHCTSSASPALILPGPTSLSVQVISDKVSAAAEAARRSPAFLPYTDPHLGPTWHDIVRAEVLRQVQLDLEAAKPYSTLPLVVMFDGARSPKARRLLARRTSSDEDDEEEEEGRRRGSWSMPEAGSKPPGLEPPSGRPTTTT